MGFIDEIERPRPEFAARAPSQKINPVTGVNEPSFPKYLRNARILAGTGLVFLMVMPNCNFVVCYRLIATLATEILDGG